ncbi:MAG: hypothetical protein JO257_20170 [Deltaproteobacteria bacterium]|nr:hypothetical protein [Deltaproteobacteria bacterium]
MRHVVLAILVLPAVAAAQPGPDDPTPPGLTPPLAAPPPPAPLEQADRDDAAADRAYGTSTAIAQAAGNVDLSIRGAQGGVLFSAALGLGGGIEISGQLGGASEMGLVGGDLKIAVLRERTWGFAIEGSYHLVGDGEGAGGVFSFGGVATWVSDQAVFSLGGGMLGGSGDQSLPYANASLIAGRGAFRPIVEVALASSLDVGFLGARIGNRTVALDVGVGFGRDGDGGHGVGPLPLLGLTLRP